MRRNGRRSERNDRGPRWTITPMTTTLTVVAGAAVDEGVPTATPTGIPWTITNKEGQDHRPPIKTTLQTTMLRPRRSRSPAFPTYRLSEIRKRKRRKRRRGRRRRGSGRNAGQRSGNNERENGRGSESGRGSEKSSGRTPWPLPPHPRCSRALPPNSPSRSRKSTRN